MPELNAETGIVPIIALAAVPGTAPAAVPGWYSEAARMRVVERDRLIVPFIELDDHPMLEAITKTANTSEKPDMHVLSS